MHLFCPLAPWLLDLLWAGLQVLAAYVLVDLGTGLYHLATDRGWNLPGQVKLFQEHHSSNTMEGFDWQPMLVGLPLMALGLWLASPFVLSFGSFSVLAQVPHYYAHRGSSNRAIRWLQSTGLILSPAHHAAHHRGNFDRNFCILSGWNNLWLNRLILPAGV